VLDRLRVNKELETEDTVCVISHQFLLYVRPMKMSAKNIYFELYQI